MRDLYKEKLYKLIDNNISLDGHHIDGVTHNDKDLTTFDIVAKNTTTKNVLVLK